MVRRKGEVVRGVESVGVAALLPNMGSIKNSYERNVNPIAVDVQAHCRLLSCTSAALPSEQVKVSRELGQYRTCTVT